MVGIVIVNYNTWNLTIECVNSIRLTCKIPYKIYIVDNLSQNDSLDNLQNAYKFSDDVVVLESGKNGGYGYGLNYGMKEAVIDKCDYIIASNNDIIYLDNSIESLRNKITSDEDIAIVVAQQLDKKRNRMISAIKTRDRKIKIVLTYLPLYRYICLSDKKSEEELLLTSLDTEVFCPNGGCYMFRSIVLEKIGYYDERIFLYAEENIIGSKILNVGKKIILSPNSQVIHAHKQSTGANRALQQMRSARSLLLYGKFYLGFNTFDIFIYKALFYINFTLKSFFNKEYRLEFKNAFSIFK